METLTEWESPVSRDSSGAHRDQKRRSKNPEEKYHLSYSWFSNFEWREWEKMFRDHQQRDVMIGLVLPLLGPYDLDWSSRNISHRSSGLLKSLSHSHRRKSDDLSLLKLPAAALGSIQFLSHCLRVSWHFPFIVALTSLISYLFQKVSTTTSELKMKTLNYTSPNVAKISINLSSINWKLE